MMPDQTKTTLYIHYPWCEKKCPYCDFNSHQKPANLKSMEAAYIQALIDDLKTEIAQVDTHQISSIFIGGGTPSLISAQGIHQLLNAIQKYCQLDNQIEITLEANPGTLEVGRFRDYYQAGINRLSIGVQSFNDQQLKRLGRIHDANQANKAIVSAQQAGFSNFNLDLMYALPKQTVAQALADLSAAIKHQPPHISWYQLTIEPNTAFAVAPPAVPQHDLLWDIQQAGQDLLATAGYQQYEISAYSQAGKQCQHNLNYWSFGDYLGIGAGAHGKIKINKQALRRWKYRHPQDYLNKKNKISGEQKLTDQDFILEFMMNALRLTKGVDKALFQQQTGLKFEVIAKTCQKAINKGLMRDDPDKIMATDLGINFLNDLLQLFNID